MKKQIAVTLISLLALMPLAPTNRAAAQPPDMGTSADLERAFLQRMVMHHHMALVMAQPVADGAVHDELRALALDIITTQSAEIAQMGGYLTDWYGMAGQMDTTGHTMPSVGEAMGMPGMPPGMRMTPDMTAGMPMGPDMMAVMPMRPEMMAGMDMMMDTMSLAGLSGGRLEAAFMMLMIPHHQEAIDMAEQVLQGAEHEEVRQLARQIIATQSAEIQQLNTWLADWYGL